MASQVTIDFANIGQQIVTAVQQAIEQASDQLVAKTQPKETKGQGFDFDIRQQILDNAKILSPILDGNMYPSSQLPSMYVALSGEGTTFRAEVLRRDRGKENTNLKIIMIQSRDCTSAETALQALLELTMKMLAKFRSKTSYETGYSWKAVEGLGGYYAKGTKGCNS